MGRKKCMAAGCGCFAYVSDLTNRRICTCGHAASNHESDEWQASAPRAAAGSIRAAGADTRQSLIYAATGFRNSTDEPDLFHKRWPPLGPAARNGGTAAPEK